MYRGKTYVLCRPVLLFGVLSDNDELNQLGLQVELSVVFEPS
jgi:hypothetical protein